MTKQFPGGNQYSCGLILVGCSTFGWSMAGIFTTAIEGDVWAILFWRSIASGAVVFCYAFLRSGKQAKVSMSVKGWQCWAFVALCSLSALCFITAFKQTSVANVAAIYATAPIFAIWLGWLFLRERITSRILLISALSMTGALLIFTKSLEMGRYLGDFFALLMTVCEAILILLTRKYPSAPMIMAGGISSVLLAVVSVFFSDQILLANEDILFGLIFGISHAFAIITLIEGARRLPVVTTALFSGLEVPLAAVLAWFILAQSVELTTIVGGSIIVSSLFLHIYMADQKMRFSVRHLRLGLKSSSST